ncbi:MAG: PadR family transcriptional regulator [Lachnospiraceae bacterium]|nr:PadR family transcriptional regulator [Lachnospiraceae bacterium]
MDSQLKRGILNICILQLLKKEDQYGYDIIKKLQEFFPDTEESTLYAILRRLNKEELTDMYYSEVSNGPQRKYYQITEKGKECLEEYIESWHQIENIFSAIGITT